MGLGASPEASVESLRFEVDAALLFELGEKLVGRKTIALAELIKNAYDADATEAIVTLDHVARPDGTITVEDDGSGMTFEVVRRHWMRIATQNKVQNPLSPRYRRITTGAKGVGRFAARRLAKTLKLESVAQADEAAWEKVEAFFDWSDFASGCNLTDVATNCLRQRLSAPTATGTKLTLAGLQDTWSEDDVTELRQYLWDLTRPYPARPVDDGATREPADPGFSALLIAPEFPQQEGELSEHFLEAAWGRLEAEVRTDGKPTYRLEVRGRDEALTFTPGRDHCDLVGARFSIHYFVYSSPGLRDTGLTVSQARGVGRRWGGVRIYLDGFRLYPYGEQGDDWLGLDEDRAGRNYSVNPLLRSLVPREMGERPLLNLPGNNALFGGVFLSRLSQRELVPTIIRQGLLENDALRSLRDFVRLGIDWMTVQRDFLDLSQRRLQQTSPRSRLEFVRDAVQNLKDEVRKVAPTEDGRSIAKALDEVQDALETEIRDHITKVAMLRVLASAGTMVAILQHEIMALIDGLRGIASDLRSIRDKSGLQDLDRAIEDLCAWVDVVEAQAHQIGFLTSVDTRQRRRSLAVWPLIERIRASLVSYCRAHAIELVNAVSRDMRTPPFFEAEMYSLLINLLTNALKAVKDQAVRRIQVSASVVSPQGMRLSVSDTGYGLARENRLTVFEPFVTTSVPDPVLGMGTGLGLAIVREIVQEHNGTVQFIDAEPPWSTCVEVVLPGGLTG